MKSLRGIQYASVLLMILAALTPSVALESKQTADEARLNVIATKAFLVLEEVPSLGLEKSLPGLEDIISTHRQLSQEAEVSQQHLSVVLADAVAFAIITEIHRSEVTRLGLGEDMKPKSIPFDKKIAVHLWKANAPDFPTVIRKALRGDDTVTRFASTRSSEEDVLNGGMIDKAPLDTIVPRIRELHRRALQPAAFGKNPSADEQLVYDLAKYQAFRDLGIIIDLYEKRDLPNDSVLLRSAIDGVLDLYPKRRVDDGMNSSSFKVWLTFRSYYPEATSGDLVGPFEEYRLRQAFGLAPFMTDTSPLPEAAKKALLKMGRPAASSPSK